uniref:Uncharacterized protein n=1 Tax=viral metagenome TaxID=1070528 RepID=A0A6M3L8S0_9ZZZZ
MGTYTQEILGVGKGMNLPSDLLYQVFRPLSNAYQKRELERLNKCSDEWERATDLYACEFCPDWESCWEEWGIICDPENTLAQKRMEENGRT